MNTKKCNGLLCRGKQQNIIFFGKDKNRKDNLTPICKKCKGEYDKAYRKRNKEKATEYHKEYRKQNKDILSHKAHLKYTENKDKIIEKVKLWRQKNPEKTRKTNKLYRQKNSKRIYESNKLWEQKNPEKVSAYKKKWKQNNPENTLKNVRKRRAKKAQLNENFTLAQEQIIREAFNDKCFNCKSTEKLCVDHHRPLSKGNVLTLNNAVLLCKSCNSSKGAKNPEEFYGRKKCRQLDKKLNKIASQS